MVENSAADQDMVATYLQQLALKLEAVKADPDPDLNLYLTQFGFQAQEGRLLDMLCHADDA